MTGNLREFLEISYDELEELNLQAKAERSARTDPDTIRESRMRYLTDEKRIKAVTVCFTDLEGRLHMLDYDKKFLLKSADNLTFDGSSIRGFTAQQESDLRLGIDWSAFYWLPSDIFWPGKVLVFGEVQERDGTPYRSDLRARLKDYTAKRFEARRPDLLRRERDRGHPRSKGGTPSSTTSRPTSSSSSAPVATTHSLPGDPLRAFIDAAAEAQRALGFANEKDHPEVAPSQFEMNYGYVEATIGADQVMLYKLICRQVANRLDMTASFLPKPVTGVNGNGMHTNISIGREGTPISSTTQRARKSLSDFAWQFVDRILTNALDLCLVYNSSVNAYRRLDPHFEAPNQIKASPIDRGSMVRIPIGNKRSARIEMRSIAPDCEPLSGDLLAPAHRPGRAAGSERSRAGGDPARQHLRRHRCDAAAADFAAEALGHDVRDKYADLKQAAADRCPRKLGSLIKPAEIQFHHEVTNQYLWNRF